MALGRPPTDGGWMSNSANRGTPVVHDREYVRIRDLKISEEHKNLIPRPCKVRHICIEEGYREKR